MALPQGYLSISQVRKYMTCPKQYQLKYCFGIQETKGSPLVVGSAFHRTIEESNRRKMETGEILTEEEMKEIYDEYWNKNVHSIDWKEDEDPEKEKDRGFSLAKIYMDEYGKHLDPMGFEAEFNVEVQGIPFKGYIDLIEKDGFIRDLKTTKKTPAKDIAEQSLQLSGYAYAYRELTGEREKGCSLDYAISLKQPKVVRYETEITERRLDRFVDTFYNVTNAIDKEIFYRNEGPNCSWCSYKDLCRGE